MKGDFTGDLTRRMEEGCLLPSDDPTHGHLLAEIASMGDWAKQEWADLHRENERLRVMLLDVAASGGLESRLLEIAATPRVSRPRRRFPIGLAAAVLLLTTAAAFVMRWRGGSDLDDTIDRLVALVAHDHDSRPKLAVETSDPIEAIRSLQPQAPFDIRLAAAPAGAELVGARICRFAEGPLVYSRWRGREETLSMYQIRLADFDLPQELPEREIQSGHEDGRCRIRVWSDDRFAYAIVHDASRAHDDP